MVMRMLFTWSIFLLSCEWQENPIYQVSAVDSNPAKSWQNGDLIFHTSRSEQSKAIQLATHSKYSHCGIIYQTNGKTMVYEAIGPVTFTPIETWIKRGKKRHYVVKRLKNAENILTAKALQKMRVVGERFQGRDYDLTFEWSDDKIYCSELIWKIYYEATGLELGKTQHLRDFDLSSTTVRRKLEERYGTQIPLDETVISPAAIFESNLLETIISN
jgi:hypothetical protein